MSITQKQIAEKLGVSQQAVAKALLGHRKVGEPLRRKILDTAKEMGYVPHATARMLRCGKSRTVVTTFLNYTWAQRALGPLVSELGRFDYKLEVKSAKTNEALLDMLREVVSARAADAFVLWGIESDVERQGELLESLGQPFVARGYYQDNHPNWCQSDFDHCGMMRRTIAKLVELGHERIALLNHDNDAAQTRRYRATFDEEIRERFHRDPPQDWILLNNETSGASGDIYAKVTRWFRVPPEKRPTAIAVGESGSIMPAVEAALLAHGVRIGDGPGQFAIVGVPLGYTVQIITGPTWIFAPSGEARIASQMISDQLMPLLNGEEPAKRIIRHIPSLVRAVPEPDIWATGAIMINPEWAAGPGPHQR